jgi:hypothetical protein
MGKNWDDVGSTNDKLWFLNYGESPRCLATAGISLSVHTLIAQKLPEISAVGDASGAFNNNK